MVLLRDSILKHAPGLDPSFLEMHLPAHARAVRRAPRAGGHRSPSASADAADRRRRGRGGRPTAGRPEPGNRGGGPRPNRRSRPPDHGAGGRGLRPSGRANLDISSTGRRVGRAGADVFRGRVPRRLSRPRPVGRRKVRRTAGTAPRGLPPAGGGDLRAPSRPPQTAADPTTRRTPPPGPWPCGKVWFWEAISLWNPVWPAAA